MRREVIFELMKLALSEDKVNFNAFADLDSKSWLDAFSVLNMHGVAPLVSNSLESLPAEMRPSNVVVLKFISSGVASQKSYLRLTDRIKKLEDIIRGCGVKCLILKGVSLAGYYPKPELRKFSDIDIYAPNASQLLDDVFEKRGMELDKIYYRHTHTTLGGVVVENHYCLLDVRGRKKFAELDGDLKRMALEYLAGFEEPGLYSPNALFALIFNLHHAFSHFIYEGISLKFLVDWILFLRKENELLASEQTALALSKHSLLKFAAVMSEVSVRHLGLSLDEVPECIRSEMNNLKADEVSRFIDDLFRPYELVHRKNIVAERLNSVRRIVKSSWKPKVYLGQSAIGFVWDKFLPILMGKKFEAD